MSEKRRFVVGLFLLTLALAACAKRIDGAEPVLAKPDPPYAVTAAEQELEEALGVPVDEIDLVSYKRVEWPNACLGYAEPGEMCAQVMTQGWLIILEAEGQQYEVHTDQDGKTVRWRS